MHLSRMLSNLFKEQRDLGQGLRISHTFKDSVAVILNRTVLTFVHQVEAISFL